MWVQPASKDAIELIHHGAIALADVEAAGMRVDTAYLAKATREVGETISTMEAELRAAPEFRAQQRRYGADANIGSREQLAMVYHKDLGYEFERWTSGGKTGKRRPQLDDAALEAIGTDYANSIRKLEKLRKLHGTYLVGIGAEVCDGFVHPSFNLNMVISFRSSSSDPNFQNIPIRDQEIAAIIRRAFIPRDGHVIVESDYSSQEVRVACALSGDEKLTFDTLNGDMHRDMAAECFMLEEGDVSKELRQATKGGFVFAEFYGDWYKQVCRNLWDTAAKEELKTKVGVPVLEHLARRGIRARGACVAKEDTQPGTFEEHIRKVEDRFWNVRFRRYHEYRKELVATYREQGYFELVTGFVCRGVYAKNQVINLPIQGPAFHCLLWSLIQLNAEMKRRRMRSRIVGQIHDSIVGDVHRRELDDYVALVRSITVDRLMKRWPWITVPLAVDVETSDTNWYEKKPYVG